MTIILGNETSLVIFEGIVCATGIFDFTVVSLFRIKRRSGNDLVFLKLVQHSSSNDYTEINL